MSSKVTYRQQYTRCGKQRCRKCREGAGHGPYWYAYWSEKGRTVSKYIGTRLPDHIETTQQGSGEEENEAKHNAAVQNTSTPTLRIYLLGQFRIERYIYGEWQTVDSRTWHRRRARALLGCLLSSPGRRLGREQIMELLWPDLDIDVAANRLNGAVHELRQILEPEIARPASSRLLRLERDILELADSLQIWVDAEAFENLLKEVHTSTDEQESERLLEEAAALYRGSYLLEELYSEWAAPRRDALQRAWVGLLLNLADLRMKKGAFVSAIETLDRLRTADPTNETALQRLMILLTQQDRRGEALQMYRQHVVMLKRDYESEPLPETTKLYEELRKGHVPTAPASKKLVSQEKEKVISMPAPEPTVEQTSLPDEVSFTRPTFQVGRHNQSPLIGRNRELDTMHQVLLTVERGKDTWNSQDTRANKRGIHQKLHTNITTSRPKHSHFILLKGESGIGKTRLAEELSLEAYVRGWAVAWSRSYEQEGTIPYRPWTEVLRTLLQGAPAITELLNTAALGESKIPQPLPFKLERLSALLPELTPHTASVPVRTPLPVMHEQERLHLWEATLGLLTMLSKIHPLLLVLDDLHWADDSSIELLTYLTHHLQDQRVLLIGTCRDVELSPQHKLRALMTDLRREQAITTISVQPLTQTQIGVLLSHLPKDIVESIQAQVAGNPLFAEELARYVGGSTYNAEGTLIPIDLEEHLEASPHRSLRTNGPSKKTERDIVQSDHSLPETIAAVLERRLNRLSSGCQTLLGKAAVLGGSFELSQLLPMAPEHDEDAILDLLEEALHAGLLTEEGTGAHITYHFWHPLIISHLYSRLSAARRAQLHRRAADAIKAGEAPAQQEKAAAIVYHLSRGGGSPESIAHYAELAGNQAYSLSAYSEAQRYYLQVIQALVGDELNPSEGMDVHTQIRQITPWVIAQLALDDPLHICRLLEHIAECSVVMGNFEEVRYLYECILDLRASKPFQQYIASSEPGPEAARKREAQIQALLWREIGCTWSHTGDYARAYECYGRGKEVMSKTGVTSGAAWACLHIEYGELLRLEGNYQEAQKNLEDGLEMLECIVQQSVPAHHEASSLRLVLGRKTQPLYTTGEPVLDPKKLQTRTERALIGDPLDIGYAHERVGIVAASIGQLGNALKHMHTALSVYEQGDLVSGMSRVCGNLGAVYILRGEHDSARKYMHWSLDLAERAGDLPNMAFVMLNLGDVAYRSGDLLEAEGWLKQSLVLSERINGREHMSWCNVELAGVQQDLGKLQEAKASLHRAIIMGRMIKSPRCIRYALVRLGDLRITEAIIIDQQPLDKLEKTCLSSQCQRQLLRAKSTLQRAIALDGLEIDNITEGKHLLATTDFLLGKIETAEDLALLTLKEAQEQEAVRTIGRAFRLLGRIQTAKQKYKQAQFYFEQAINTFREGELRLDYARTLHAYGVALLQQSRAAASKDSQELEEEISALYQRSLKYLHEARDFFVSCQAATDLSWAEHILAQVHKENAPML